MDAGGATKGTALAALLDDELGYDATTTTRLSNHLPMALVALQRLGASDDRLIEFADRYRSRLAPLEFAEPVGSFDAWLTARGQRAAYGPVREYLGPLLDAEGVEPVVRRHLPHLVDGLSGAAFHGLIRLAYALESASPARVAAGLAYLTQVHQPLGDLGHGTGVTDDPLVALRRLSDVTVLQHVSADGNIGERMRQVATHPAFAGVVDWLVVTSDTPRRLTGAAVALYAATDDFTALHGVTASHAIAIVSPFVEDTEALSSWWFQALAAAYVTIGAPGLDDPAAPVRPWLEDPAPWDEVVRAGTLSDDEHVVKLVYSARALHEHAANPLLLAAAARQAGIEPEHIDPGDDT
ncbi:MAG TPA: questin oxidase family protein [Acidimicrobiales bacterium]|nr:questin oxidase family protein [Acidimicrobiales bacterium]